jgi:two-component system nitrogen regulation response regulator GlnG
VASLLVIDDEPNVLYALQKGLGSETFHVHTALTGREGLDLVRRKHPDAVILDVRLTDMSGLEAFDEIRRLDPRLPVIVITAHGTTETAIEATKRGAFEYLLKPLDLLQLRELTDRAVNLSRLRHVPAVFEEIDQPGSAVDRIVGKSPAMQEVYKAIGRVASQDMTVLLVGESGTGKELVARAIYHHGNLSQGPFLTINCAAIPESLLESELFGHERGAFTGADRQRIGKFEQAHGGTIFLDEIGDMSPSTQAKVLRLLQEQRFERLGGNETIQTQVRVIAATNQNLEELARQGRFRADLFYRLQGFTIRLPGLRERLEDLPLLVDHFVKRFNRNLGKHIQAVPPQTIDLLARHPWPGNVRELENVIKYGLVLATGDVLSPDWLPGYLREEPPLPSAREMEAGTLDLASLVARLLRAGECDVYRQVGAEVDRIVLHVVLTHVKGNQVQASELLGISRTTLRAKLRALGMGVEKQALLDGDESA